MLHNREFFFIWECKAMTHVNIRCNGMPSFSAQWQCAKLGGFAMIASATNGFAFAFPRTEIPLSKPPSELPTSIPLPASIHDLQQPLNISYIPFRRLPMSPFRTVSNPGILVMLDFMGKQMSPNDGRTHSPGFLTIKAMSSAGSPPMLKNSSPFSSTKSLNVGCVARRTRWP